jgi:peroxiredoxin
MKIMTLLAVLAAALLVPIHNVQAQEPEGPAAQLAELIDKVRAKLHAGQNTEEALAEEIKAFDVLLAEHQATKTDEVAHILLMKAMLYAQVFDEPGKAIVLLQQLERDFPETERAKHVAELIPTLRKQVQVMVGKLFPDFNEKDLDGNPLSIAQFKGKVVLVDFWAMWCPPCIAELPNLVSTYEKHHASGFEIVGISLDENRDRLTAFIQERSMTWPQYFDGRRWQSKLVEAYGIDAIPATFLLDREGRIIAKDLSGDALEKAVASALAKN